MIGRMWWHDEGPLGHVDDVLGFRPTRLWASWANFTTNSRRCMEFGYWTEEPALVEGAHDFLVRMLRSSEDLQAAHDEPNPDLALVEYDDEAMAEALAEMSWDDDEEKL